MWYEDMNEAIKLIMQGIQNERGWWWKIKQCDILKWRREE